MLRRVVLTGAFHSYLRSITPERRYPTHQLGYKYTIPHDSDEVRGVITTFQKVSCEDRKDRLD